jgi:hypothetical protein
MLPSETSKVTKHGPLKMSNQLLFFHQNQLSPKIVKNVHSHYHLIKFR